MAKESNIWYVEHPITQYKEDVKALARKAGLKIIDAVFDDGEGAEKTPKLTKKKAGDKEEPPKQDDGEGAESKKAE